MPRSSLLWGFFIIQPCIPFNYLLYLALFSISKKSMELALRCSFEYSFCFACPHTSIPNLPLLGYFFYQPDSVDLL